MSGLSINSLNNYASSYYTQNTANSAQSSFQNLGLALQSGNLSAAQTAFASLQQSQNPGTQSTSSNNPVTADMTSLANALNSGNLSAAQASYTQLQQDSQAQGVGHHHHHHGGGGGGMGSAVQSLMSQLSSPSSTSTGTSSTSSAPGTLNVQV
jgi:hypothetical protein